MLNCAFITWGVLMMALRVSYGDEPREIPDSINAVKLVRLIIPGPPGASFDRYGRLIARHIGRFLPEMPMVTAQNIPGASGKMALTYLCERAPQDGSVFGLMLKQTAMFQILGEPTPCDVTKLHYIGSPARLPEVLVVWYKTGVHSIFDAPKQIVVGATTHAGAGNIMPKLANEFIGTNFRLATGYTNGPTMNLAMERGEIDARSSEPWSEWLATKREWVEEGKIRPLLQMGRTRHAALPNVPLLTDVIHNGAAEIATLTAELSRPVVAPPGTPLKRVEELRRAFERMIVDPMFQTDAHRIMADIEFISGTELEAMTKRIVGANQNDLYELKSAFMRHDP